MILQPSITVTSSSNSAATGGYGKIDNVDMMWAEFLLNVTAAGTAAGDTLTVYVQASADGGTTWDDFISFTPILGNGGAKKELFRWQGMIAPTTANAAPADAALATGIKQGPHGSVWRVKWVVVNNTTPTFTFTVTASGHDKQASRGNL